MGTTAFDTIRRASLIRDRHPDTPSNVAFVAVVMATFADGKTGTSIRPTFELVAERTGLSISAVQRAVRWLEQRGELRRDKQGHRGSAACFTYLGGKPVTSDALSGAIAGQKAGHQRPESQSPVTPHLPDQETAPSGPSRPSGIETTDEMGSCQHCGSPLLVYNAGSDEAFTACTRCNRVKH